MIIKVKREKKRERSRMGTIATGMTTEHTPDTPTIGQWETEMVLPSRRKKQKRSKPSNLHREQLGAL